MPSQTSDSGHDDSRRTSFWNRFSMKSLIVCFFLILSVCFVWSSAQTADTKRPSKAYRLLSGTESQSAGYVPGELIVKFRDEASANTVAEAHSVAGGRAFKT